MYNTHYKQVNVSAIKPDARVQNCLTYARVARIFF